MRRCLLALWLAVSVFSAQAAEVHGVKLDDSIQVGDSALVLNGAGVRTKLEVWPEMIHVWHLFASFLPEGQQAVDGIGGFLKEHTA